MTVRYTAARKCSNTHTFNYITISVELYFLTLGGGKEVEGEGGGWPLSGVVNAKWQSSP